MKKNKSVDEVVVDKKVEKPLPITNILEKLCDFELVLKARTVSYLTINSKKVVISHWDSKLKLPNGDMIEPATQEQLKAIYDESPTYQQLIKAPNGYKAKWELFK